MSSFAFNPAAEPEKKPPFPPDLTPYIARRTARNFCRDTFRAVVDVAVGHGMISEQALADKFGRDVLSVLRKSANPDPATCREILAHIATLKPEEAIGEKARWRHANPRPREERTVQPL
jgi:hypothetical protein